MSSTTLQIRIDSKIKDKARKILEGRGLGLSSGVNLFLHNVAITDSIPLDLRTSNGYTIEQEQRILRNVEDSERHGKRYTDVKKMLAKI